MHRSINYVGVVMTCWPLLAATQINGQLSERYVGCFADNTYKAQTLEPVLINRDDLTIEMCIHKCYNDTNQTQSETTYAALSNGRGCSCRKGFDKKQLDRNCNVKCSGAPMQACGGNQADNFYSLYTVCRVGYFGPSCDLICHCKRQLPCNRETGICPDGCEEQWTGTSCNITNILTQYIGCYGDGFTNNLAMDVKNPGGKTGGSSRDTNSIEFCIEICSTYEYTYAGMQYGFDCNCGEKYDRYGYMTHLSKPVNCSFPCPANRSQKCGGLFANSVFYVCPRGFYGKNCVDRCHCSDGGPCRVNGTCLTSMLSSCKPGWTGSACNSRDCKVNNGDCSKGEQCEIIDLGYANKTGCRISSATSSVRSYIGCYVDTRIPAMERKFSWQDGRNNTIESCRRQCASHNYSYAGLQYGYVCFCGDVYDRYGPLPESRCNMKCNGNQSQICGGPWANSVYAVEDISTCSSDNDCKSNETCSVISYTNVSQCQFKQDLHRMDTVEYSTEWKTIGIILGTLLTISLLVNALLITIVNRINRTKSRNPDPVSDVPQSEFQPSSTQMSNHHEIDYNEIPEPDVQNNVYEHIIPEQRRVVLNTTSGYAELITDNDYWNVASSI